MSLDRVAQVGEDDGSSAAVGSAVVGSIALAWASRSVVGNVRSVNEDRCLTLAGLFVVADGMGGHAAGDVASELVVSTFAEHESGLPLAMGRLPELVDAANRAVLVEAARDGHQGMGSTAVGLAVIDNGGDESLVVLNVGDSRCYQLDADGWRQITRDHSHVQELVDAGEIDAVAAASHPLRNVVTRAIGMDSSVHADFVVVGEEGPSRFILCSDGVSGELADEVLMEACRWERSPAEVVTSVIDEVLRGRAADNATIVVVDARRRTPSAEIDDTTGPRRRPASSTDGMIRDVPSAPRQPEGGVVSPSSADLIDEVP